MKSLQIFVILLLILFILFILFQLEQRKTKEGLVGTTSPVVRTVGPDIIPTCPDQPISKARPPPCWATVQTDEYIGNLSEFAKDDFILKTKIVSNVCPRYPLDALNKTSTTTRPSVTQNSEAPFYNEEDMNIFMQAASNLASAGARWIADPSNVQQIERSISDVTNLVQQSLPAVSDLLQSELGITIDPSMTPIATPTMMTTMEPTMSSTMGPTMMPTMSSTMGPTMMPTMSSTMGPTMTSTMPTTMGPTMSSTMGPTMMPTMSSTMGPTMMPTMSSTMGPTMMSTMTPMRTSAANHNNQNNNNNQHNNNQHNNNQHNNNQNNKGTEPFISNHQNTRLNNDAPPDSFQYIQPDTISNSQPQPSNNHDVPQDNIISGPFLSQPPDNRIYIPQKPGNPKPASGNQLYSNEPAPLGNPPWGRTNTYTNTEEPVPLLDDFPSQF